MKKKLLYQNRKYYSIFKKFHNLKKRLLLLFEKEEYQQLSNFEQKKLINRFQLFYKRVMKYQNSHGLKTAGTAMAFTLITGLANAQPYTEIVGEENPLGGKINPFSEFDMGQMVKPAFVDIDNDADLDVFVGDTLGNIHYYRNTGDQVFEEVTGAADPFNGIDAGIQAKPTFVDIDGDNDFDVFVGANDGTVKYFENIGSQNVPKFNELTGIENPFDGEDFNGSAAPAFVDIDNDSDYDAFVGSIYNTLRYYENIGDNEVPVFSEMEDADNPADGILYKYSVPTFADMDDDGDMDLFVGTKYDGLKYYENTGTASEAVFEYASDPQYLSEVNFGNNLAPDLADLDNDGDYDVFVGNYFGQIRYYNNEGTASSPDFVPNEPINIGYNASVDFVDIDNDGDYDAFGGEYNGSITFMRNDGSAGSPDFRIITDINNPFQGDSVTKQPKPAFVDIDGDGDFDLFFGNADGEMLYYENAGTANTANFVKREGAEFPFDGVDAGDGANPAFVDIDDDGDMDAFIGVSNGEVKFYLNNGDANVPLFVEQTGANNPLDGISWLMVNSYPAPEFADVDGDGDYDLILGSKYEELRFFENTGTAVDPEFTEQLEENNPFQVDSTGSSYLDPAFVDIDGDDDLDLFFGTAQGTIRFLQNDAIVISARTISQADHLEFYPNPASDRVQLEMIDLQNEEVNIQIYNISGQVVLHEQFRANSGILNTTLDVSRLNGGVYILQIDDGNQKFNSKLVIK
jgi:large repetitive protein